MTDFPPPYDSLPDGLKTVILTTYQEDTVDNDNFAWELGFGHKKEKIELSLPQLLDRMRDHGRLDVLKAVHSRCSVLPGLWSCIRTITGIWTYPEGGEISQGFNFTCANADRLKDLMESSVRVPNGRICAPGQSPAKFCRDDPTYTAHDDRDCYRELIKSGPGLHVCVTRKPSRPRLLHDIHIDKWQEVCSPTVSGECSYDYVNMNSLRHKKDAAPWWLKHQLKRIFE
jgi:hypothetical protein